MSVKRVSLIALFVLTFAAALFFKQQFLSASERDLMRHVYGLQADQFHDPMPGKAYAFYINELKFDSSPVCALEATQASIPNSAHHLKGVNLAGQSYNEALAGVAGYIGDKIIDIVRAKDTHRLWTLNAQFQSSAGAGFSSECLQDIDTATMLGADLIYIVDTVYYRSGDTRPFLVKFKSGPVVLACDEACPKQVSVTSLLPTDRITRFKWDWGIMQFFQSEPEVRDAA